MSKKRLSVLMAICLIVVSTASFPMQNVSATETAERINPNDILTVLDDITIAGQAWESVGFSSEDIAEIAQMERKDASYYEDISEQIAALSMETDQTRSLENELLNQAHVVPYATNGNPPETPQEQNERIKYVTQVALSRYGDIYGSQTFNKYIVYLYMSHYIDNPNYSKESPGFDSIYSHVITSDDIRVYDDFITQSKFSMFSSNLVNFVNEFKTATSDIYNLQNSVRTGKNIALNSSQAILDSKDFRDFTNDQAAERAHLIATSLKDHYESTASARELLDAIYMDLEPENVSRQCVITYVTGILGFLAETTSIFGFGLSASLVCFNFYMNLYERARLVALQYSLSARVAVRVDELLWE